MKKKTSILKKSLSLGLAFLMALSTGVSGVKVQGEETGIKDKTVTVALESVEHLTVKLNDLEDREINVSPGSEVKIDVEAEDGYQIDEVKAEDSEGYKAEVTQKDSSYYVRADRDLTIKVTVSDLQVVKPGSEDLDWETANVDVDSVESGRGRTAPYDADEFNKLIESICDFGNVSDIMLMANVGEGITTLPSIHDYGIYTDFVRYYSDGSYAVEHRYNEGRFTTTDGEEVFCCYPDFDNTVYKPGEYASYDATRRFDEETIKTIGMMLYYFDNEVACSGLNEQQRYLIRQCVIWSVAGPFWGLNSGLTIEAGNGVYDSDGHLVSDMVATALTYGAEFAADEANREEFTCWGIVFEDANTLAGNGTTQLLSQFFYERDESPKEGEVALQKVSSNPYLTDGNPCYSLAGAEYEVKNSDGEVVGTLTTDEEGNTQALKVNEGTYYVKETAPSPGYGWDYTEYAVEITSGQTATVTSKEPPLSDSLGISLIKIDRDSNGTVNVKGLEGARFEVKYYALNPDDYNSAADLDDIDATRTWVLETKYDEETGGYVARLDDDFKVSGEDFYYNDDEAKCLPIGVITVEEVAAPEGYTTEGAVFSSDSMTGPVEGKYFSKILGDGNEARLDGGNEYTVSDKAIRGGIKVAKWDNESNSQNPQGDASLESTTIEILNKNDYDVMVNGETYGKDQPVLTLTTDAYGNAQTESDALPYGLYEVKETGAPAGYLNDGSSISQEVFIGEDGVIVDLNNDTNAIKNNVIRGGVKVAKWDNGLNTQTSQGGATLEGAEFAIISQNSNSVIVNGKTYKKGETLATLRTDANGNAQTSDTLLPYGTYTLKETKAPTGYLNKGTNITQTFTIRENGVIVDLNKDATAIKNQVIRGGVQLGKWDNELNTQNPQGDASLEGAEFAIINENAHDVIVNGKTYKKGQVVATLKTDANGNAQTASNLLPYGTYTLKETKAPTGYLNKGTNITQTFTIRENGVIVDLNKDATAIKNQVIRGGVQLGKWDNELNTQNPQGDASLEGAEFAIINENAHDVIVNGKTYKKGQVVATLKTDANGNAQTASNLLPYGTYTLKETKAPTGYLNEGTNITQTFTVRENGVIVDLNKDATAIKNQVIRGGVQLGKWDNESNTQKAQGAATLAGAEFEITNQSSHDVIVNGKTYKKGQVVATLVTDENGIAKSAKDLLPYGKYSYEETKEPKGYLPTGSGLTGTFEIKENGVIVDLNKKDTAIKNNVIRGDITFTKSDAETSERMANIPFKITSNTTGESHVIYTDENGYYSSESKYVKHSENTNAETAKCGTWFGLDINGDQVPVKDSVGAFPYDTYIIQEVRCEANEGKALFKGTFTISMHAFTIDYGTITNADLAMQTTAKDAVSNMHTAYAREEVTIVDTVFYTGLKKNQTYTIKGIIMDKDTKEPLLDADGNQITAETNFTTVTKNGLIDVTFVFDGSGMEGKDVVVFEECYDKDGNLIVDHKNIEDKGQTIYFEKNPEIKTSAKDSETKDHISTAKENVSIIDTVSYKNLTVGNKYTISGTLMDKATGKAMKDSDGNKITAETSFTAKTADGSVEVVFTFDASDYEGKTTVVFEDLYYNGKLYVSHADLTDEGQTIYFPEIHTRAKDKESQLQETYANPDEKVTIEDTVAYKNLIQGKEYTVKGVLMDKETGEKLLDAEGNEITSETTFTAENEEGQVNVEFTFDASTLAGKATVVFEDLYYNKNFVATHADITDEGQTVYFPEIKTTAKDAASDSHNALPSKETTIIDTVKYTNLLVGKTYTVKGTLMDKDTKEPLLDAEGNQITGETSFTAQETSGEVEISFTFDSSLLEGTTVVVFEDAYENGHKVATHTEITDEDQSVHFPEIKTTAKDADTQGPLSQAKEKVTIEDTVSYKNLVKGKEYTVKGTLMNKETGEKLLDAKGNEITAETSFKAEATEGEVIVSFTFDASTLAGQTTVVFENLYDNEKLVATHSDLSDEGQTVYFPEIKTTAKDAASDSQNALPSKETTIVDTVKYSNLVVGKTYTVKGVLMDKDTKEPLLDGLLNQITGETTFTAEEASGEVEVKFTFDSSALKGKTVVVFEDLYESDHKVATHSDITDKDQSVHFPKIKTTATDREDGDHTLTCGQVTVVDTIKYENLVPGYEYKVSGVLMDKSTGEKVLVGNKEVTAETSFTPEKANGTVEVTFSFDASSLGGKSLVVFEKIYDANGKEIGNHEDINDEDQTVTVSEKGKIVTNSPGGTKAGASTVKTGDVAKTIPYLVMMVLAIVAATVVVIRKRKMNADEK